MKYILILILLFYFYSFFGWLMEVILGLLQHGKFINRGFLIGPICPIYGFGGCLIFILLTRYKNDPIVLYVMCVFIAAILEYTTSYLMEKIFKNRWWDYSRYKFNINGRICLETMIPFGLLALLMIYIINPALITLFNKVSLSTLKVICYFLTLTTLVDIIISCNIIFNLKNISATIKSDSTEAITKKVKEKLWSKNAFYRRIFRSFPDMKIMNKLSILKDKVNLKKNKK